MPNLSQTLRRIAAGRAADPLAPVTVVVPSHVAGIQLRRRLGALGAFAGVRFETLPRLAEIIAGGELAAMGRLPLARPIGDYLASRVALEARTELAGVRELAGFGRVLRLLFRRLRRAGITTPEQVRPRLSNGYMGELLRLYGAFRARTAAFYDDEDLLDAAAAVVSAGRAAVSSDFGAIYVVPPGALSAGAQSLLQALRRSGTRYVTVDETTERPAESFLLAPDPASEAREAVREVLARLEAGAGLQDIAVFHGAGPAYRKLLRDAFDASAVPAAIMPGTPLSETVAGRAVLSLAALPAQEYSRTAVMDFLALAPLRRRIPSAVGEVVPLPPRWDAISRKAGVTKRPRRWASALSAETAELRAVIDELEPDDWRRGARERDLATVEGLRGAIEGLVARLDALLQPQSATTFIASFKAVVDAYLSPDAHCLEAVIDEIDQLGTVGAVGGSFALNSFVQALRANLEIAAVRERDIGKGVLVGDYRIAAGLHFEHVVLCGAFEGSFPAGPGGDTLVDDAEWAALREQFPWIEDVALRIERAHRAAQRAVSCAAGGRLLWTAPLYEPGGTREYYASPLMVQAAAIVDASVRSASDLRRAAATATLKRAPSPLAAGLRGPAIERGEASLRRAVAERRAGAVAGPGHPLYPPLTLLRSRRRKDFGEYDGNLDALAGRLWNARSASPTSLEAYSACGFKYLCAYVLRLNVVEEPEEREVMDAAERGSLMHEVLDAFFKEKVAEGRPAAGEAWGQADLDRLLAIAGQHLELARQRGRTGLDIFAEHDAATILADFAAFLEEDTLFRLETGARPSEFEVAIPPAEIAGILMRGFVDRIDRTPDGRRAWVIDYKTGSAAPFRGKDDSDPLMSGTRLQLPAYVPAAAGAEEVSALYWFISRKGEFERIAYQPTPQNTARFEDTVKAVLHGIGQGSFPAVPGSEDEFYGTWDNCRYCDFNRICSRGREQDFVAKAAAAGVRPWLAVAETAREPRP